jgi:hypothetical protein
VEVDTADLHTETFTNSQGWTIVRVTHLPTSTFVERSRSELLVSPVEAQSQCIKELKKKLARRGVSDAPSRPKATAETAQTETETADAERAPQPTSVESVATDVTRAEFDALAARVARLEKLVKRD